ncbi:hypothetical protein TW95_gp1540 [Pandoravirus inopinatum]|uniref:Uncharacterized protein n=1 Tax=Pandoravirus inopinatum TaxID=1605721 RepID=A0A0B5J3V1_9VIRU|nr:hypothetical protein TW95_gp1540 [Pandoravirus inopinatum]AJF98274.1 hypothetical protein [Pandoravirus inopinatum]
MSRQSRFNAGFGPQATVRPTSAAAGGDAFFAGRLGQPNAPGTRSRLGLHNIPIGQESDNIGRDAQEIGNFLQYAAEVDAAAGPLGPESRLTNAQRAALQRAAQSQSPFAGRLQDLNRELRAFAAQQAGAGAMEIAPRTAPGSRAGSLRQQQAPLTRPACLALPPTSWANSRESAR